MKPRVLRREDGFDILVDKDAWVCHTTQEGNNTCIRFRHSNGKHPLTVKDIADLGYL